MSINGHSDPDKPPEPVDCVFLWHTTTCLEALKRAAGRSFRLHPTNSIEGARALMSSKDCRVVLVEAEPHRLATMPDVFKQTDVLWIAVFLQFDGERWIEMLEQGAFDVVCAPFHAKDLRRTVHAALTNAGSPRSAESTSFQSK